MSDDVRDRRPAPSPERIKLTPLERYFAATLAAPTIDPSMTFGCQLHLSGHLNRDRLLRSWRTTIAEHPRTFARLDPRSMILQTRSAGVDATIAEARSNLPFSDTQWLQHVDPRNGQGVRLEIQTDGDRWRLLFSFHHAICDGVGASRLIYATMRRYAGRPVQSVQPSTSAKSSTIPATSKSNLNTAQNDTPPAGPLAPLKHLWHTVAGHNGRLDATFNPMVHEHNHIPPPNQSPHYDPPDGTPDRVAYRTIDAQRSDVMLDFCRRTQTPLNDLMVAAVMAVASTQMRRRFGRRVAVMNPVGRRSFANRRFVGNALGLAILRRKLADIPPSPLGAMEHLMDSIPGELDYVRDHDVSAEFEIGLAAAGRIPGSIAVIERLGIFRPTAMVSTLSAFDIGARMGGTPAGHANPAADVVGDYGQIDRLLVRDFRVVGVRPRGCDASVMVWRLGRRIGTSLRIDAVTNNNSVAESLLAAITDTASSYAEKRSS